MEYLYRDLLLLIAQKLSVNDALEFSLINKKHFRCIWNNRDFWNYQLRKKYPKMIKINCDKKLYFKLEQISTNPLKYLKISIVNRDQQQEELIFSCFDLSYPYVGIIDHNYFSVVSRENLYHMIHADNFFLNFHEASDITLSHYCFLLGIPHRTGDDLLNKLYHKLSSLNEIYQVGESLK